ncbi:MAG: APC family permease [Oligoflexia bacterium]|nr:APC family permease [Oligoflexia bacterium]
MNFSKLKRVLLGQPLSSHLASHERIPKWKALAVLSSDALSSVAYATEEILIPLAIVGLAALAYSLPVSLAIVALIIIVTISYRQTIDAYPGGSGAYFVVKENLGVRAGLVAGASLMIDYTLTVAVSVAAGVENIASAVPFFQGHKEVLGAAVIVVIMLFNLRGTKESASLFALPTYLFLLSFLILIGAGAWKLLAGEIPPAAPLIHETYPAIPLFLLLRAFSSGCTALTGIEAISDGVSLFQHPAHKNAKTTLVWMSVILVALFLGITTLAHVYGVVPAEQETAVSVLARKVFGDTFLYYALQGSTALILLLAANTAYSDFPRLSSFLAKDRFLPRQLASLGDRLVFSNGILGLSLTAIFLLFVFQGDTHRLIPLYAIGVFLSFTLSQAGMVRHHLRRRGPRWLGSFFFNFLGAFTTLVVLVVVATTKFLAGAWIVILLIPLCVFVFLRIREHYEQVGRELTLSERKPPPRLEAVRHAVIVPISGLHRGVIDALRYALSISHDVRACYVELDPEATERVRGQWRLWAPQVPFIVLPSPYRSVIEPLLEYIDDVEKTTPGEMLTVVIPEFVTAKWWQQMLHNQTAFLIRAALMFRRRRVVTSVRYHLKGDC